MQGFRGYLVRRLIHTVITVWVITTLIFLLFRSLPGDPTAYIVDPTFPPEVREELLRRFGLDKPVWQQYTLYMWNLIQGDLGVSFFSRKPVTQEIGERLLNTLILSFSSFLFAYPVGIISGALLAARRGSRTETMGIALSLFFRSAPLFWTGMLAIMLFSYQTGWFPHAGMRSVGYEATSVWDKYLSWDFLHHLVLPTIVAGLYFAALPLLLVRNTILEVLNEDFIELARAKGLSERAILYRHALRNSILPVVTAAAVYIGLAIGGLAVVEVVFSWPGLGREIVQAVQKHDFPVAQGAFLLLALTVSIMNLVADLAYGYLDPRIVYR